MDPQKVSCYQLVHHLIDAEPGRLLPTWEPLEAGGPLRYVGLSWHQHEHAMRRPVVVVDRLERCALEGLEAWIDEHRPAEPLKWLRPDLEALGTLRLEDDHRM